jgi:putative transposase
MKFAFIAKHRSIWPVAWQCEALGVSRAGFHAWLTSSRPYERAETAGKRP